MVGIVPATWSGSGSALLTAYSVLINHELMCNGYRHNTQPYTVSTHLLASMHVLLITNWRASYICSTSITSVISTLPSSDIHSLQALSVTFGFGAHRATVTLHVVAGQTFGST